MIRFPKNILYMHHNHFLSTTVDKTTMRCELKLQVSNSMYASNTLPIRELFMSYLVHVL